MTPRQLTKRLLGHIAPGILLYRGQAHAGVARLALTFDDGPHPAYTERLLDILAREGVPATFFLQGAQAAAHPHLVRAIHAAGQTLGNHSYSHRRPAEIGAAAFIREVEQTQAILQDAVGAPLPRLFRPPFGAITTRAFAGLVWRGYRFVYWSVDSDDSVERDPTALVARVAQERLVAGDILLFHEDYAHTVAAMPDIIRAITARAFRFTAIGEL